MAPDPADYDREERLAESWWLSRHHRGDGRKQAASDRRGRRTVLLDVLLLAVMAGVLAPWALHRSAKGDLGPYAVRVERRILGGEAALLCRVSLPADRAPDAFEGTLEWTVTGADGRRLHREADLLPPAAGQRTMTAKDPAFLGALSCEIAAGGETLRLRVPEAAGALRRLVRRPVDDA